MINKFKWLEHQLHKQKMYIYKILLHFYIYSPQLTHYISHQEKHNFEQNHSSVSDNIPLTRCTVVQHVFLSQ